MKLAGKNILTVCLGISFLGSLVFSANVHSVSSNLKTSIIRYEPKIEEKKLTNFDTLKNVEFKNIKDTFLPKEKVHVIKKRAKVEIAADEVIIIQVDSGYKPSIKISRRADTAK